MLPAFFGSILELVTKTSTDLPPDVRAAMKAALGNEPPATQASQALTIMAENIDQAAEGEGAICQDTGLPTFEIKVPVGANEMWMAQQIRDAIAEATRRGKLRPNSVDSVTGKNSGNNLGPGSPVIHFEQWDRDDIDVRLLLKGGGCENMNIQYSVPCDIAHLGRADRDLGGRSQVHPARGLAGPGEGVQSGRHRRVHRRRPRQRLRRTPSSNCSERSTT